MALALDGTVSLNAGTDELTFSSEHGFADGDIVTYESDLGGSDTSGLVSGTRYRVVVVDEFTIQLQTGHAFTDGDVVTYNSDLPGDASGLVNGATYQVSVVDEFSIKLKDYQVLDGATTDVVNNTITFGSAHQFQDGDILQYHSGLVSDTSGLVDGGRYRVTVIDADTIQLSDSRIIDSLVGGRRCFGGRQRQRLGRRGRRGRGGAQHHRGWLRGVDRSQRRRCDGRRRRGGGGQLGHPVDAVLGRRVGVRERLGGRGRRRFGGRSENIIDGSTLATIEDSTVDTTAGAVTLEAMSDVGIQAFGLAAAISAGGAGAVSVQVAAAGVVAFNTATGSVEASIGRRRQSMRPATSTSWRATNPTSWRCWGRRRSPREARARPRSTSASPPPTPRTPSAAA